MFLAILCSEGTFPGLLVVALTTFISCPGFLNSSSNVWLQSLMDFLPLSATGLLLFINNVIFYNVCIAIHATYLLTSIYGCTTFFNKKKQMLIKIVLTFLGRFTNRRGFTPLGW